MIAAHDSSPPCVGGSHEKHRHRFLGDGGITFTDSASGIFHGLYLRRRRAAKAANASRLSVAVVGSGIEAVAVSTYV